jgi:hypothetical protein
MRDDIHWPNRCIYGDYQKGECLKADTRIATTNYKWCTAFCKCNFFGLNCDPCDGCSGGISLTESSDGGLFSIGEGENQEEMTATTNCDDYYKWMNLTKEEKVAQLDIHYCSGDLEVHPDIHAILEDLADSNDSNHMSCEEFNNAYDLEGMLQHRRGLHAVPGGDVRDSHVLCLTPDKTKTSKGGKNESEPSKAAKKQGKGKK